MQYLLLLHTDEKAMQAATAEENREFSTSFVMTSVPQLPLVPGGEHSVSDLRSVTHRSLVEVFLQQG
jgi:hypothetical protein